MTSHLSRAFVATMPPALKAELLRRIASRVAVESGSLFTPHPWQVEPYEDWASRVMLLTGSAGGGKSRVAAQKLHWLCMSFPGVMAVALRKTRESMVNSTVLFLESEVVGKHARHRPGYHRFEYPNSSILAYGGMANKDQREQIRSIGRKGGLDAVWMEEATMFEESDFNELLPRLRAGASPFHQLILTTNPDSPLHWIYQKLIIGGKAKVYPSSAADNPSNPEMYKEMLGLLTGIDRMRLVEGQWVRASGIIHDKWSDTENVTEEADYVPGAGQLLWAVDDGYAGEIDENTGAYTGTSHPRVFLLCQLKPDGVLDIFAEDHAIRMQPEEQLDRVAALGYPEPDYAAVDKSAAALRGRLYTRGINTRSCGATVLESIKEMRRRLSPDVNGVRLLRVHPRCKLFRQEVVSYVWDAGTDTERPVKMFDHTMDACRYLCWTIRYEGS